MGKVVLIDGSVLMFRSILNWSQLVTKVKEGKLSSNTLILPSHYTYFTMVISVLKKVRIAQDDIVILALDGRNSYRRAFYPIYKAQRQGDRDKNENVDWYEHWGRIDTVNQKINDSSCIHVLKLDKVFTYEDLINSPEGQQFIEPDVTKFNEQYGIEGDDIIAQATKFYNDRECVVVTIDKDLYQLDYFDNVKIFSMNLSTPRGGKNGGYVVGCDPLKILASKCRLGDKSDNIIVDKDFPEEDAEVRRFIIDVLKTPSFLQEPVDSVFRSLSPKENILEELPFYKPTIKSLAHRFFEIYTDKNEVTWDYCVELDKKKKETVKKKRVSKKKKEKQNV